MYALISDSVPRWREQRFEGSGFYVPVSVNSTCPSCCKLVNFTLEQLFFDRPRQTVSASGTCPNCAQLSHFWIIEPAPGGPKEDKSCQELYIRPIPRALRIPIRASSRLSPTVQSVYRAALECYNHGLWDPCAVSLRRMLEGILVSLLGDVQRKIPLYEQLQNLPTKVDLTKPLISIAQSLRSAGNLAAHFGEDKETDQSTAEIMLDLMEYLIDYIFELQARAQELSERIK